MLNLVINGLVLIGAGILLASLGPIRRLIKQLSAGRVRRDWCFLTGLIIFIIAGYFSYVLTNWNSHGDLSGLVVALVFFSGACFVWVANSLSLQTALDVRRVAALEHENITDPLMNIYNRRYLDRRLVQEVTRAIRYNLPLSILLLDIDHFKNINDTHGHQIGDLVLKALGKILLDAVRTTDIVARYGGEEILIIASNTPGSSVALVAERLRHKVESSVLVPPDAKNNQEAIQITISIGVSDLSRGNNDVPTLVADADRALYRAKQEGRNRVTIGLGINPSRPLTAVPGINEKDASYL